MTFLEWAIKVGNYEIFSVQGVVVMLILAIMFFW